MSTYKHVYVYAVPDQTCIADANPFRDQIGRQGRCDPTRISPSPGVNPLPTLRRTGLVRPVAPLQTGKEQIQLQRKRRQSDFIPKRFQRTPDNP